jgi:hypothetical protein
MTNHPARIDSYDKNAPTPKVGSQWLWWFARIGGIDAGARDQES